jgi:hypothetical protein
VSLCRCSRAIQLAPPPAVPSAGSLAWTGVGARRCNFRYASCTRSEAGSTLRPAHHAAARFVASLVIRTARGTAIGLEQRDHGMRREQADAEEDRQSTPQRTLQLPTLLRSARLRRPPCMALCHLLLPCDPMATACRHTGAAICVVSTANDGRRSVVESAPVVASRPSSLVVPMSRWLLSCARLPLSPPHARSALENRGGQRRQRGQITTPKQHTKVRREENSSTHNGRQGKRKRHYKQTEQRPLASRCSRRPALQRKSGIQGEQLRGNQKGYKQSGLTKM